MFLTKSTQKIDFPGIFKELRYDPTKVGDYDSQMAEEKNLNEEKPEKEDDHMIVEDNINEKTPGKEDDHIEYVFEPVSGKEGQNEEDSDSDSSNEETGIPAESER